ncbi:MAG TPA: hypothetical protein P5050_09310 [Bacteroidia bacterium]|nr:hypothetical protein [Bacteroidia bacterium]HRS59405.1 hypothetical protein [Bacteroidia bacterium]HRU68489.1 hypothetical protein [Bacteroidia bacterium]
MRKNELKIASAFSLIYFLMSMVYSYFIVYQEPKRWFITLSLIIITICNAIIFLYLKKFLKYYYNVKDRNYTIYTIIALESFINFVLICCYKNIDPFKTYYFVYVIILAVATAVLMGFYMALASKLMRVAKKSTRLMIPFAYSFYLIPLTIFVTFFYALLQGQDLVDAFEIHDTSLIFSFLKSFPFLLLMALYYRAWLKKHRKHQHSGN